MYNNFFIYSFFNTTYEMFVFWFLCSPRTFLDKNSKSTWLNYKIWALHGKAENSLRQYRLPEYFRFRAKCNILSNAFDLALVKNPKFLFSSCLAWAFLNWSYLSLICQCTIKTKNLNLTGNQCTCFDGFLKIKHNWKI